MQRKLFGLYTVIVAAVLCLGGCGQKGSPSVMTPATSQVIAVAGQRPTGIFATEGDVSRAGSGWSYEASDSQDGMVYIPFEGVYPDKGGRIQSPWFSIPDNEGAGAYYRLTFKAKCDEQCYWWLEYRDKDSQRIPDCNSKVYPGPETREYDEVVYVPGAVRSVQICFVTKGKVEASDIRFTPATPAEAAEWCDNLYSTLPPLNFTAPPDSMAFLPKTAAALHTGKPWRIVMLGNSHMNDAFNSLFTALVRRDFPQAHLDVVASVRGQTGNAFYREPENFEQYIAAQKPDLLITLDTRGGEDLAELVRLTREKVGCEIIAVNGGMGGDWRTRNESRDWRNFTNDSGRKQFNIDSIRESANSLNIAFWDLTTPSNDYLAIAPADLDIGRDYTHSNDIGKQITGRVLHQYFLTAKESRMEVFRTDGEISRPGSGWTYQPSDAQDGMVYIPFEGMYPDKGGRTQSAIFPIPQNDLGAYYRLTFKAKSADHCYWWLDYFDKDGQRIPDSNSKVYPGDELRDYDEIVYVPGAVRSVQIAFVSKAKVEVRDVILSTAPREEAAQWCDDLYKTLPQLNFTAPQDSMVLLPKTADAMKNGKPWRIVMLGHSIMNDTFNSLFMALVQRDFPEARLDVVASVRGSTGNSFYRNPDEHEKYIVAKKPDLLIIGDSTGSEDLEEVVRLTRENAGCEILVINYGLTGDWRERENTLDWRSLAGQPRYLGFNIAPVRDCARKLNVAFWDVTTPCQEWLASAGNVDFTRDHVHNNDAGKQIIGRVLHQYFLTAQ